MILNIKFLLENMVKKNKIWLAIFRFRSFNFSSEGFCEFEVVKFFLTFKSLLSEIKSRQIIPGSFVCSLSLLPPNHQSKFM